MPIEQHSRLALATDQLEDAIRLHLDGRYASATTLAGAAEEVFGRQAERMDQSNIIKDGFALVGLIGKFFPKHQPYKAFRDYADEQNATRNSLKHMRDDQGVEFTADLAVESAKMIARALENAGRIGVEVSGFDAFSAWFHEHIVGV
jgi:hypothetical protein